MAIINIKGVKIVSELYPVRLIPVFKDYLWGGTKLKTVFNKKSELIWYNICTFLIYFIINNQQNIQTTQNSI